MKKLILTLAFTVFAIQSNAEDINLTGFAELYFTSWNQTQEVGATKQDLENYLNLLKEDVGHQHLPYDPDASRAPDGKEAMRKGMTYYLGVHTEYKAELVEVMTGFNVVIIKYNTYSKGIQPQTGQEIVRNDETIEVLETEDGRVGVIRKYSD